MKRNYKIWAVDMDGTLCKNEYPDIGSPNIELIKHLIRRRRSGDLLILWTCRAGNLLEDAVKWCRNYGLEFDAVNRNIPGIAEYYGSESRKVFADVYIDDKAADKLDYNLPYGGKRGVGVSGLMAKFNEQEGKND